MLKRMTLALFLLFITPTFCLSQTINAGDHAAVVLEAWGNQDRSTEQLIVTDTTDRGAARFHAVSQHGVLSWGMATAATVRGSLGGEGVGSFNYGEVTTGSHGSAWGANDVAINYSPNAVAIGVEINGENRSGIPARRERSDGSRPFVVGSYINVGGSAPTNAGLWMETSVSEPMGMPYVAIWLSTPEGAPAIASDTGILIERVESGEAFRTLDGQRIALTEDGQTFVKFDPVSDTVQIWKHGVFITAW